MKNIELKKIWLYAFLIGVVTHAYVFTNHLLVSDEIYCVFGGGGSLSFGRWLYAIMRYTAIALFGTYSMPWLYGIISIALLAMVSMMICLVFEIDDTVKQIFISCFIMCIPVVTESFGYMFIAPYYIFAILLSVAVLWIDNIKINVRINRPLIIVGGALLIASAMGIYQAYIGFIVGLMFLRLMYECTQDSYGVKQVFYHGLQYIVMLFGGGMLYMMINKILLWLTHTELSEYKGINEALRHSIAYYLNGVGTAYKMFFRMFCEDFYGLTPSVAFRITLIVVCIITVVWTFFRVNDTGKRIIYLGLILFLPLVVNCMFVVCEVDAVYTLMLYSVVVIFIWPLVTIDFTTNRKWQKGLAYILIICLSLQIVNYVIVDNESYMKLEYEYDQAYAYYNTMITRIKSVDRYDDELPVAIIGGPISDVTLPQMEQFDNLDNMFWIGGDNLIVHTYARNEFMKYFLGFEPVWAENIDALASNETVCQMTTYPDAGSIAVVEDTVVVKLSELH